MKKRVIFKHGRYWPQYKFAGLLWRYCAEQADPYRQPEPVGFDAMLDAINFFNTSQNCDREEVVWKGN